MPQSVAVDLSDFVPRSDLMAWIVCLSAGLFFFYEFFQLNIFDVINQPLRHDFQLDAAQISWMSSAYLWADILFLLPAGIILDFFSTRTVILSTLSLCVVGTFGFALTDSFILASLCHFLSGIGGAFCFLSCVVLVSHWFAPRRQALVIGSLVTMAFLGGMMAHTPFAWLYELFGWRKALLIDGVVGVLLLIWIYWILSDKPHDAPSQPRIQKGQIISGFVTVFSNPQNWWAGFYTSLLNLPIMVLCALWGASYLQVVHHVPALAASNIVSLIYMGSAIGCPLAGWLSDVHARRKPLMIVGAIATLITLIPLFLGMVLSQTLLSILFFALGLFTSTQVISYPLVAESNSPQHTGAATALASFVIMGGGAVGQVVFGWLMTHHAGTTGTTYTVADFQYAMWMFPVTVVAVLLIVFLIRETYCKRFS